MPASHPLRVLVAEDHPVNQRLVQAILGHRGHALVLVASGREALAALEREEFDVVLMDVQMPDMDGFQTTAAIRAREKTSGAHVRILAMTAHALAGDRERCLAAGMDGYLAKPISPAELIELLERSAPVAPEPSPPPARPPAAGAGESDLERRGLAAMFVADALRLSTEMRAAITRRDAGELRRAAHQLVGSAGYFAAQRIFDLAQRLEALGKAGDLSGADQLCEELAAEVARFERTLAAGRDQSI